MSVLSFAILRVATEFASAARFDAVVLAALTFAVFVATVSAVLAVCALHELAVFATSVSAFASALLFATLASAMALFSAQLASRMVVWYPVTASMRWFLRLPQLRRWNADSPSMYSPKVGIGQSNLTLPQSSAPMSIWRVPSVRLVQLYETVPLPPIPLNSTRMSRNGNATDVMSWYEICPVSSMRTLTVWPSLSVSSSMEYG